MNWSEGSGGSGAPTQGWGNCGGVTQAFTVDQRGVVEKKQGNAVFCWRKHEAALMFLDNEDKLTPDQSL